MHTFWALNGGNVVGDVITTYIPTGNSYKALAFGNGKYVIAHQIGGYPGGNYIYTSSDGVSFSSASLSDLTTQTWNDFALGAVYANSKFVIVGTGNYMYSVDGDSTATSFVLRDQTGTTPHGGYDVCSDGTNFLSPGTSGLLSYSTTGLNTAWGSDISFGSTNGYGCCYGSSLWVIVGASGNIHTSTNHTTWTARTSGVATDLLGVSYSSSLGLYCACGASGVIITSPDGTTWTSRTSGVSKVLRRVRWSSAAGRFYAVGGTNGTGEKGVLISSTDGITWSLCPYIFSSVLQDIAFGTSEVVCTSWDSAYVYQSVSGFLF